MGQSDTESTSSSMRGNPGSPRDPSTLFEEVSMDTLGTQYARGGPGSPSTSSDSSELDSSMIITGERPKTRQRDIPFIDLTSLDGNEPSATSEAGSLHVNDPVNDVHGMYSEFAARVQRQLHAARERVVRMRAERNRIRIHALRTRIQNCPYITTYRDGRRHSPLARQRPEAVIDITSSPRGNGVSPIVITDSPGLSSSMQGASPSAIPEVIEENPPDMNTESLDHPYHQGRSDQRITWRQRREALQRIQDQIRSCVQDTSDEALARRLQAQFDQECIEEQPQSGPISEAAFLAHVSPDLGAGPVPSPVHSRRTSYRRGFLRRHNLSPHFTPASGLPDLLLPFVSVTTLPPPLHHFGDPGQNQNNENEDFEVLWNLSERIGPAKSRGLSKEVIDRIPSFRFSASNKDMSNGSCVVCMMDYTNREKLRKLPCNHDFHSKCIDRWLKSNRSCPICRETVTNS